MERFHKNRKQCFMTRKKRLMAICYDFDGTLAPGNMLDHHFIPELKMKKEAFWEEVRENAKNNDMDEILSFLEWTMKKAKEERIILNKKFLNSYGEKIKFFEGVEDWFGKINDYAKDKDMKIEHYIISSGIKSIIEGTSIKENFKHIFASEFKYDSEGEAIYPAVAINYTTKTQYLFRINKGILNNWNDGINKYTPDEKRPIPFSNLIYIGDGLTDIPAMKMLNYQGGYSIAIYVSDSNDSNKASCQEFLKNGRCSFIAPADYTENKELDEMVKLLIDKISAEMY